MVDNFRVLFYCVLKFFQMPITIEKYTFSMWQIFVLGFVLAGIGMLLTALFGGSEH